MRILITGSREWENRGLILRAIRKHAPANTRAATIVHGDHWRGVDVMAKSVAAELGLPQEPHPADWHKHGKAAGPIRNQEMVDSGVDVCLAFPMGKSRGTRDCMARAERAGIPVHNYGEPQEGI